MKTFKVYYKNVTAMLMPAKDEIDAAIRCSIMFGLNVKDFCYAIDASKIKQDIWKEAT